jgi:hypothetical protein
MVFQKKELKELLQIETYEKRKMKKGWSGCSFPDGIVCLQTVVPDTENQLRITLMGCIIWI